MHAEGVELVHSAVANPLTVDGDKETIGPLQTLRQYEALADGSHQRLGMSIEGLCLVFLRIGLIRKSLPAELQCMKIKVKTKWIQLEEARKKARKTLQNGEEPFCIYDFRYNESYERGEDVQWLNDIYGPLEQSDSAEDGGVKNMTGYDIADGIRRWLVKNNHEKLSMCEVILLDDRFQDLREHVGLANAFWSHMQQEPLLQGGTLANMAQVQIEQQGRLQEGRSPTWKERIFCVTKKSQLPKEKQRFWLDYTSLRQKQNDFKAEKIVALIKDIGSFVASFDEELEYSSRSFCALELYAAVAAGCPFVGHYGVAKGQEYSCYTGWGCSPEAGSRTAVQNQLKRKPINTSAASTRRKEDKAMIDGFIRGSVGFERLDVVVTDAITNGSWFDFSPWIMGFVVGLAATLGVLVFGFPDKAPIPTIFPITIFILAFLVILTPFVGSRSEILFGNKYTRMLVGASEGMEGAALSTQAGQTVVFLGCVLLLLGAFSAADPLPEYGGSATTNGGNSSNTTL